MRKKTSPIYGWPPGLVEKALRCLSSDGALARKEFDWPLPMAERFYHTWVLQILEKECRLHCERFQLQDKPCLRCAPEIDFLRGEAGSVGMGDFLDDPEMQHVGVKILKAFLDVRCCSQCL